MNVCDRDMVELSSVHDSAWQGVNFVKSIALSYMCPLIRNVWLRNIFHDLGVKVVAVTQKNML